MNIQQMLSSTWICDAHEQLTLGEFSVIWQRLLTSQFMKLTASECIDHYIVTKSTAKECTECV